MTGPGRRHRIQPAPRPPDEEQLARGRHRIMLGELAGREATVRVTSPDGQAVTGLLVDLCDEPAMLIDTGQARVMVPQRLRVTELETGQYVTRSRLAAALTRLGIEPADGAAYAVLTALQEDDT